MSVRSLYVTVEGIASHVRCIEVANLEAILLQVLGLISRLSKINWPMLE